MRGAPVGYNDEEQALREFVAAARAEYAFKAKVEKQRWEAEVLVPMAAEYKARLARGDAARLKLTPDRDLGRALLTEGGE